VLGIEHYTVAFALQAGGQDDRWAALLDGADLRLPASLGGHAANVAVGGARQGACQLLGRGTVRLAPHVCGPHLAPGALHAVHHLVPHAGVARQRSR